MEWSQRALLLFVWRASEMSQPPNMTCRYDTYPVFSPHVTLTDSKASDASPPPLVLTHTDQHPTLIISLRSEGRPMQPTVHIMVHGGYRIYGLISQILDIHPASLPALQFLSNPPPPCPSRPRPPAAHPSREKKNSNSKAQEKQARAWQIVM